MPREGRRTPLSLCPSGNDLVFHEPGVSGTVRVGGAHEKAGVFLRPFRVSGRIWKDWKKWHAAVVPNLSSRFMDSGGRAPLAEW